jgi:hypothetical protein
MIPSSTLGWGTKVSAEHRAGTASGESTGRTLTNWMWQRVSLSSPGEASGRVLTRGSLGPLAGPGAGLARHGHVSSARATVIQSALG